MTVEFQQIHAGTGDHVVQFYERDSELVQTVGDYIAGAIHAGEVAVVISTGAHRQAFELQLEAAGIDPAEALENQALISLDAAETLARLMPNGRLDREAFCRVIGGVIKEAAGTGRAVRAYGEMVALLWDAGDVLATVELEELWNDLGRELPFSLLCGYHSSSVSGAEDADARRHVWHLHSSILQTPSSRTLEVSRRFPPHWNAPRDARRFVVAALRQWGHCGSMLDEAQLVVSELATNAVVHARSPFLVVARSEDSGVRLSVHDLSLVEPNVRSPRHDVLSGRGLYVIAELATNWGVETACAGKVVWAELPRPPSVSAPIP